MPVMQKYLQCPSCGQLEIPVRGGFPFVVIAGNPRCETVVERWREVDCRAVTSSAAKE
jgi:hypothetical protein